MVSALCGRIFIVSSPAPGQERNDIQALQCRPDLVECPGDYKARGQLQTRHQIHGYCQAGDMTGPGPERDAALLWCSATIMVIRKSDD